MKKILLRLSLFFLSFFVIGLFLYSLFYPLYKASSIIFTFAITPFDIAKVYPKIWIFIKKSYFLFLFISYLIIFNYLYNTFQKYINFKNNSKNAIQKNIDYSDNGLKLLIGKNSNRKRNFY